jgi:DNA sulfur modification protein DndC
METNSGSQFKEVVFTNGSAFLELGLEKTVELAKEQIRSLYLSDYLPWVIGYSGGKDSTATLQLVWEAVRELPADKRTKSLHVISTDTLVENPIVALWVENSLEVMRKAATEQGMPVVPHRLTPKVEDSFWVNLIGRGYPAPRKMFRWCTSRLKIEPSNTFISEMLNLHGEAIVVLGTRAAESNSRKKTMEVYAKGSTRADFNLSRNGNPKLDRCWIYAPVRHWSNDDVWEYLGTNKNPWGVPNDDLMTMYRDGTKDRECPLVVDSTTPSCGDSRFGCFVCTLVEKDKSMSAMIQNDDEKKWMQPLSDFRNNWLDISLATPEGSDQSPREAEWKKRDFRRKNGTLTLMARGEGLENSELVHGPYIQSHRADLLRAVFQAQVECQAKAPETLRNFKVISDAEIKEIRKIWIEEKYEIEDLVPQIYEEVFGTQYFDESRPDGLQFSRDDFELLRELVDGLYSGEEAELHYQTIRELVQVEKRYQSATRRSGIYQELSKTLSRNAWRSESEALLFAREREQLRQSSGEQSVLDGLNIELSENDSIGVEE